METNETNETLFFALWNQILEPPNFAPASKKPKKCGILPHWDPREREGSVRLAQDRLPLFP
jgi:hypothetical protein